MPRDKRLSRYFFVALMLGTTFLFFYMVRAFLVPVLLAAVFCTLFFPFFERLLSLFRGRRALAAVVCCFALLLGMILPLYGVADLVAREAIGFYNTAEQQVHEILTQGDAGPLGRIKQSRWIRDLRLDQIDWRSALQRGATTAGSILATVINKTSRGTLQVIILVFVTLFTMFYFFRDGERLIARVKYLVPMEERHEDAIISRFAAVSRATIKGTVLIALTQGTLAGLTLWIFGVPSPLLWGMVATLGAMIPMVGVWIILYPAAFVQMLTGHLWQGVGILLVTVLVIVNVDNLMRPRLVGQEAGMHDLMVFFSTLGGIGMFGPVGIIVGPVVAALFLSILDIYSSEFKRELDGLGPALPGPAGDPLDLEPATVPKRVAAGGESA
jgi:predicted PurR-regulated permease PerM